MRDRFFAGRAFAFRRAGVLVGKWGVPGEAAGTGPASIVWSLEIWEGRVTWWNVGVDMLKGTLGVGR